MNTNFTDFALLHMSYKGTLLVLRITDAMNPHTSSFYVDTGKLLAWMDEQPNHCFLDTDMGNYLRISRLNIDTLLVNFTWVGTPDPSRRFMGITHSFRLPVSKLMDVLDHELTTSCLINLGISRCQSRIIMTPSAQRQYLAMNKLYRRSFNKFLHHAFTYGRSSTVEICADYAGCFGFRELTAYGKGIAGSICIGKRTMCGKDHRSHEVYHWEVHT